jgi:hypothetical protein
LGWRITFWEVKLTGVMRPPWMKTTEYNTGMNIPPANLKNHDVKHRAKSSVVAVPEFQLSLVEQRDRYRLSRCIMFSFLTFWDHLAEPSSLLSA